MGYIGSKPANKPITSADIEDSIITAADLGANSVDSSELVDGGVDLSHMSVNSIDSDQYVDGSIDLAHMSSESVDEDNLHISNAGTNGQFLSKQSGNSGGLTWADAGADFDTAITINESGADADFRVEGDTDANCLFVDASTDRVGIGTNAPDGKLHIITAAISANRGVHADADDVRIEGGDHHTGLTISTDDDAYDAGTF